MAKGLIGVNMTNFFNRELFMYSLGDIKFKKPVSLKKVAYITAFFIFWTLPIFVVFGLILNPLYIALLIVPPIALGHYSTKPVFGGKTLIPAAKTVFEYWFQEPRGWTDLRSSKHLDRQTFFVENEIWISRRRELQLLAMLKEKQKREEKELKHKNKRRGKR